jgi:NTE family protein
MLVSLLICLIILASGVIHANEARPKIGLVLSGGGARGAAHVGVLRVLEELQIPIDYVAGTSMGSIVGGLYASGLTADQIAEALTEMDWDAALQDRLGRRDDAMARKRESDRFRDSLLSLGLRDGQIQVTDAAIQGQNVILALQRFTAHVAHIKNFDDLVLPFRAVATDIITGRKIVLGSGDLATSMRASMAVPGAFAPVQHGEALLVDGGISDNIPIDVAREMGADKVIVVDISTPLHSKDEIGNLFTITDQLTRLMTQINGKAQIATLTEQDIILVPELGDITSSAFDRAAEAITIGEATARAMQAQLAAYSVSEKEYENYLAKRPTIHEPDRTILDIRIDHNTNYDEAVLHQRVNLEAGSPLDLDRLEQNLTAIYGIGNFQHVGYELMQKPDGTDVQIRVVRKATGPNYLRFGLEAEGYADGDTNLQFLAAYTKTELNSTGGEWTSLASLGDNPTIETYLYQPIGKRLNFFFYPRMFVSREKFSLYDDDNRIGEYKDRVSSVSGHFGYEFGSTAALLVGLDYRRHRSDIQVGSRDLPEPNFDIGATSLIYRYDTLDDLDFPSRGSLLRIQLIEAREDLGSDEEYRQWRTSFGTAKTWRDYTLILGAEFGGTDGNERPLTSRFRLGGYGKLTALKPDQVHGEQMGLVTTVFYRRFGQIKLLPVFIGGILEYGGAWQDWDDAGTDTSIFSAAAFIGIDSPIGPAQFGVGYSDQGDSNVFFRIGKVY